MESVPLQEKLSECQRMILNISKFLPDKLSTLLNINLRNQDFVGLMKLVRDNYQQLLLSFQDHFTINDINDCIGIRHKISHQVNTTIAFANRALNSLRRCQKAFGIQSALVPLRVLACKTCDQVITRTAQPTVFLKDLAGVVQPVTRTYDVQVYVVGNVPGEHASRENTWYPGWVSTRTFCSQCQTHIGYRFDWAPEDRVDLTQVNIQLAGRPTFAMVVNYPDGSRKDLTHVVSDGEVRRHRYGLFERKLKEIPP